MTIPDPDTDPRAFWACVAGVAPEQLLFATDPHPLRRRRSRWLERRPRVHAALTRALHLWRLFWFGPHHPDPAPMPPVPLNLAPWTNRLLAHPDDAGDAPVGARLRDRLLWCLSHPATRYETHAWRCAARTDRSPAQRLESLRRSLAGKPRGAAEQ